MDGRLQLILFYEITAKWIIWKKMLTSFFELTRMAAETAHFCGIFDGTNTMFPDVFSKSVVLCNTALGLSKDLLKNGRETRPSFMI